MVLLFGLVKNLVWLKDSLIAADASKNAKEPNAASSAGASVVSTKAVAGAGDAKAEAADTADDVDVVGAKIRKRPPKA